MIKSKFFVRTKNGIVEKNGYIVEGKYKYGIFKVDNRNFHISELGTGLDCTPPGMCMIREFKEHLEDIDESIDNIGKKKYIIGKNILQTFIEKELRTK